MKSKEVRFEEQVPKTPELENRPLSTKGQFGDGPPMTATAELVGQERFVALVREKQTAYVNGEMAEKILKRAFDYTKSYEKTKKTLTTM